jgi:signal transduction histidine kinase/ligand-binding sensor domain-containing protein
MRLFFSRHKFLHCLLVLTFTADCYAQSLHFEKTNGLSQSTGYSIIKDKQGFLWIGTGDGLNRYDGVEMKSYKPGSHLRGTLSGRIIRSDLLEDNNEKIWFSTEIGLHSFDKKSEVLRAYPLQTESGSSNQFANPLLLENGNLWLASASRGIFKLDTATGASFNYPVIIEENPVAIQLMYNGANDKHGNLWFATKQGLLKFNIHTLQWQQYFSNRSFYTVAISRDTLYIGEGKQIAAVPTTLENQLVYSEFGMAPENTTRDLIHRVYIDKQFNVWAGDESGNIYCKRRDDNAFRWRGNANHSGSIRTNYPIYSFYADDTGILWTGGYMLGLLKAFDRGLGFHTYPEPGGNNVVETLFVNTFFEMSDHEVWLGTFQKGIISLDKERGTTKEIELPYKGPAMVYGKSVHIIQRDSHGKLWTGSSGHLFVMEPKTETFKSLIIPTEPSLPVYPQVWSLIEYENGWLLGTTVGVYEVTETNGTYKITQLSWLGHSRVVAMLADPDGKIWIAFESGGITIVEDPRNQTPTTKQLEHTNVKSFLFDKERSILYICTADGLVAYHTPTGEFKIFGEADGLTNSFTYSVLRNDKQLWISTNAGLFKGSVKFPTGKALPDITFINFTQSDGLPDNQFNAFAASAGPSGDFYFGTPQGIVWFDPDRININPSLPRIVMIEATANGQATDSIHAAGYRDAAHLPYFMNNLNFRFRGIEYLNPTQVQYAYQLVGWDKEEVLNGTINEVRYNNLTPGDYVFRVRAANSSRTWSKNVYTFKLTIEPPFWQTWWFIALIATATLALVIAITRQVMLASLQKKLVELERQQELDAERQRISREMHDDIGAGLTQITLMSEFARNRNNVETELAEIAVTSRQLVNSMSEIIWSLNPENKSVGQLLSYLREQLNRMLEYSGMEYSVEFGDDHPALILSSEATRNLILITREIVNNAIKHSGAKLLMITGRCQGDKLVFVIRDNGKGFDPGTLQRGNGLKNIRSRVSSLGGELDIVSAPRGTSFSFEIPLLAHGIRR